MLTVCTCSGKELRPMLARMRKSSRQLGYKEAWSKDSPLFCLAADADLSDHAAETVRFQAPYARLSQALMTK